jgi:hypothetical protein
MTNPQRTWISSMPAAHLGVCTTAPANSWHSAEDVNWIKQNYDSNAWTSINLLAPEINFDTLQVACCFSILAEQHKKNTWILLRMDNSCAREHIEYLNQIVVPSDNFFPYLYEKNTLMRASANEFSSDELLRKFLSIGVDKRLNHLSKINRNKLVNMMWDLITTKNIQSFNINKFEKNIYTTIESLEIFNEPWAWGTV